METARSHFAAKEKSIFDKLKSEQQKQAIKVLMKNDPDELWELYHKNSDHNERVLLDNIRNSKNADKLKGLWHLIAASLGRISAACKGVQDAIEGSENDRESRVVLKSCYSGPAFQHSHGLSVFFPWREEREVLDIYENLGFAKEISIMMKKGATEPEIQRVEEKLRSKGLIVRRSTPTIICYEPRFIDVREIQGLQGVTDVDARNLAAYRIEMEGATEDQVQAAERELRAKNLEIYRSTQTKVYFDPRLIDIREIQHPDELSEFESRGWAGFFSEIAEIQNAGRVCEVEGTGWARFLRKYLQVTRRERRNQDAHMGEVPLRIDPPNTPVVPLLLSVRTPGVNSRGLIFSAGNMKNPPDGFYRDKCES
jgi:hypothetical protein